MLLTSNIYTFTKDINLKFTSCNENLARVAGLDSPIQIKNKTDFDIICWQHIAESCQTNEYSILKGELIFVNVFEQMHQAGKVGEVDVITTTEQLFNKHGKCIGLVGANIDVNGYYLIRKAGSFNEDHTRFYLPSDFGNTYLTKREVSVLQCLLLGQPTKKIASTLGIKERTAEDYIQRLKLKFQCNTKGDIIAIAINSGLSYLTHNFVCRSPLRKKQ